MQPRMLPARDAAASKYAVGIFHLYYCCRFNLGYGAHASVTIDHRDLQIMES